MSRAGILLGAVIGLVTAPATAQRVPVPETFFGTWTLVSAHTHYPRGVPPVHMRVTIEPAADGLAYRSESRYGDRPGSAQFTARLDATPVAVAGSSGLMAPVALSPAADGGIDAVYLSGRRRLAWSHWSVTADGRELNIVTTTLDAEGEEIRNVVALERLTDR